MNWAAALPGLLDLAGTIVGRIGDNATREAAQTQDQINRAFDDRLDRLEKDAYGEPESPGDLTE